MTRLLAIDIGARHMGWAAQVDEFPNRTYYGLVELPGTKDLPRLFGHARNALDDLVIEYKPAYLRFVPAFISRERTSTVIGEALIGLQSVLKLVCWDNDVTPEPLYERTVRIQILGRGDFGLKDPRTGGLIKDSGREEAKLAVMAWCQENGFRPASHDVGDAIVLAHYDLDKPKQKPVKQRLRGAGVVVY